ncbi:MAG: hypothetical protein HOD63_03560 [Bacteroidetes bacterium]|jgi:hypothetical protein|nr:hypothetical protein [Bacteroidota bacterium]MBT3423747.1 hypothetical protein [Bacteroidota bacterium]MBT4337643.1 hypothetical protein [Bacteroidota bacterium]MBT7994169.1 hypothetical protein [Bacteroidota bacterium]
MKKNDNLWIGVVIGLIMSVIAVIAFYFIKFPEREFGSYLKILVRTKDLFAPLLSLAGIPNLVIFYLFINRERYKTAKGLIMATFLLVLAVILIKVL